MSRAFNMTDCNGFVVKDYSHHLPNTPIQEQPEPVIAVVSKSEIWEVIEEAHRLKKKIAIFVIGECLIDWS